MKKNLLTAGLLLLAASNINADVLVTSAYQTIELADLDNALWGIQWTDGTGYIFSWSQRYTYIGDFRLECTKLAANWNEFKLVNNRPAPVIALSATFLVADTDNTDGSLTTTLRSRVLIDTPWTSGPGTRGSGAGHPVVIGRMSGGTASTIALSASATTGEIQDLWGQINLDVNVPKDKILTIRLDLDKVSSAMIDGTLRTYPATGR